MKPHIICHMLSSVDGRIDGEALEAVTKEGEYEATAAQLGGDAWICGRTTMQRHFAEDGPFISASNAPAGPPPVFVTRRAELLRHLCRYARQATVGQGQPRRRPPHLRFERAGPGQTTWTCSGRKASPTWSAASPRSIWPKRWPCSASISAYARCCSKAAGASTGLSWRPVSWMSSACCWSPASTAAVRCRPFWVLGSSTLAPQETTSGARPNKD